MGNPTGLPAFNHAIVETFIPERLVLSAQEFVAGFTPPDYVVDGIIQRGYLVGLTARTGHGKTAVAMYLAQSIARGQPFHGRRVKQGAVLFLAGENPDDIRARFIVLADHYGFDIRDIAIHFVSGVVDIAESMPRIKARAKEIGNLMTVVVDTAAAYFRGDDSNSNTQQGNYARQLRALTELPGKPAVVVNCHPIKNAARDNLLPMGGSAFLNEIDGNLCLWADGDNQTTLHWQGKFRGPEFDPLTFAIKTVTSERVKDSDGRLMPSVVAAPMGEIEIELNQAAAKSDENVILAIIGHNKGISIATMAKNAGWASADGKPHKSKVSRTLKRLEQDKLVSRFRGSKYQITTTGKNVLGWND